MLAENSLSLDQIREIEKTGTFNKLKVTLLDVRTSEEVKGGRIEKAVNVPVGELEQDLALAPDLFKKKYGFNLPTHDSKTEALLVYCKSGMRTRRAIDILSKREYKNNLYAYFGGWDEYSNPNTN
ncbi:hypothetical protein GGI19_001321 [Coemansia pectinata]|uniref:Rhodanese domain-containing protein n=1 Tax=Coemansia pectinata TaxID=1052879 RepID=A0A9W8LDC1_9FUNG|nr:hypothetical protein GGI19_001321 [Coemansia pectinata]